MTNPKVIELFAGVGGFRLGLEASGWQTVFSNQWEPSTKTQHASSCYIANFGSLGHSNVDITKAIDEDLSGGKLIPSADLVVGGFPCQDYSVAKSLGSSKGIEGKKGVLWWQIHRLIEAKKPKFVFLENVDRLLKSPSQQRGRDFAIMLRTLGDLGYRLEWRVVNAAEEGFPQRRIRVFIIASRLGVVDESIWAPSSGKLGESGILGKAFPADVVGDVEEFEISKDPTEISELFNLGGAKSPFLKAGHFLDGKVTTFNTKSNYDGPFQSLGSVLLDPSEVPDSYWIEANEIAQWQYLKGAKSVSRTHSASGTKYTYSEGSMSFPDATNKPSRTILTGEGGRTPSRFKHVVEIDGRYRRLLPVELERLNGFPDNWTAVGAQGELIPDSRRAFFMGNALVVGLIARVGEVLKGLI